MRFEETKDRFGFRLSGGMDEHPPSDPYIQVYVKSSVLSRIADLPISPRMTTPAEIDHFIDGSISALETIRSDAKCALTMDERA
jgi:hypothetical protein